VRHHDAEPVVTAIDLEALEQRLPNLLQLGHAKEAGGATEVDLGVVGVTKLLGSGRVSRPLRITVATATEGAVQKVAAAGGEVRVSEAA